MSPVIPRESIAGGEEGMEMSTSNVSGISNKESSKMTKEMLRLLTLGPKVRVDSRGDRIS